MMRAILLLWLMLSGAPLAAQSWTAHVIRDAVYDAGRVTLPGLMSVACAARTGRANVTPDSRWWEVSVAPPWQFLIDFTDQLVPVAPHEVQVQMTLFVDQTGYQLPIVHRNELEGGWQVMLGMSDPMFAAINGASRLVLQVGTQTVWELPVAGLAEGVQQARAVCEARWNGSGQTSPTVAVPRPADLHAVAQTEAAQTCSGTVYLGPYAVKSANIDGDGVADVILDYNDIKCGQQRLRPNVCGASACSIDVYLSRTFAQRGRPENLLGTSASVVQLSNGNMAVSASGNLSMCQSTAACAFLFYWDGTAFTMLPN